MIDMFLLLSCRQVLWFIDGTHTRFCNGDQPSWYDRLCMRHRRPSMIPLALPVALELYGFVCWPPINN